MKIVEKICDTLGLYKEVEEEVVEQEETLPNPKRNFVRSNELPKEEKQPFFSKKQPVFFEIFPCILYNTDREGNFPCKGNYLR